ncbi:glycosyl hydrolase family 3 C-terminal domain-containing protein [Aspergillus nidulans var. acristatus]
MHSNLLPVLTSAATLLSFVQGQSQQPYRDWAKAYEAAEALVLPWTIEQQANISVRYGTAPGFVPFEPSDGPTGLSGGKGVSGWVGGQTITSSWNRSLIADHYSRMAVEFRKKGYNMLLGPSTGPLETNRTSYDSDDPAMRTSSNLDDRTLHELYLWPWIDGVANGLGSVMCVMNRVNGIIGCENDHIMNGVLKNETGFRGFIVPDVTAPVDRTAGLLGGLDWNSGYSVSEIMAAVKNGSIPESVMTEHALRIVATQLNLLQPPEKYASPAETTDLNVRDPSSKDFIRRAGSESIVLLKNKNNTLPLRSPKSLGIFGKDAANLATGPTPQSDFANFAGDIYDGHLVTGGGSYSPAPYVVSPLDALTARAAEGQGFGYKYILSDNWTVTPPESTGEGFFQTSGVSVSQYASESEHCLVFINAFGKEGSDRRTLADEMGDKLVNDVADYCGSTIVVMNNAGVRLVDAWIEHENVTAVLNAGALGQESGHAIVDVLFGDVNPSAKLVYTIAKSEDDYNGQICECCECDYTEGLYIDYRHFDQAGIEPRFEFGFGLCLKSDGRANIAAYTTFTHSDLTINPSTDITTLQPYATGAITEGGPSDLFEQILTISASISNTGAVAGAEVAQLYLSFPDAAKAPVRQLRGFEKVYLEPGETKSISFPIQRRDLSIWDERTSKWKIVGGKYGVVLGRSSRDFTAEETVEILTI